MNNSAHNADAGTVAQPAITLQSIQDHIPPYLTVEQKEAVTQALSRFPTNTQYYLLGKYQEELLQGDGWTKLQLLRFSTGERISVLGMILSNTCDVAPENKRELPPNVVFAPIMKLANYAARLEEARVQPDKIKQKMDAIKEQAVTTIFYLPAAAGGLNEDHIVLLDDVHTMPASAFQGETTKRKEFTLSNLGFYLLIFKLSIHFCRLRENVARA